MTKTTGELSSKGKMTVIPEQGPTSKEGTLRAGQKIEPVQDPPEDLVQEMLQLQLVDPEMLAARKQEREGYLHHQRPLPY